MTPLYRKIAVCAVLGLPLLLLGCGDDVDTGSGDAGPGDTRRVVSIVTTNTTSGSVEKSSFSYDENGNLNEFVSTSSVSPKYQRETYAYSANHVLASGKHFDASGTLSSSIRYGFNSIDLVKVVAYEAVDENYENRRLEYEYGGTGKVSQEQQSNITKSGTGLFQTVDELPLVYYYDKYGRLDYVAELDDSKPEGQKETKIKSFDYPQSSYAHDTVTEYDASGAVVAEYTVEVSYEVGECDMDGTQFPQKPQWRFMCIKN